jgi:uncharacterized protein (TIGR03067 family)
MLLRIAMLLLLAAPLRAADRPAETKADKGPAELQGTWKLVSIEIKGEASDLSVGQPRWVITGDKVLYGGDELAALTAHISATPKLLDVQLLSPKRVLEGIYAVEKDTLRICLNKQTEGVKERPHAFSTKDQENWRLLVFERERSDVNANEGLTGFVGVALRLDAERQEVVVNEALGDSPAKKAGLKKDDVVLKVAGGEVTTLRSTVEAVRRSKPRTDLVFHIQRDGKEMDITVKVGILPFSVLAGLD